MLYACAVRIDVIKNLKIFCKIFWKVNKAIIGICPDRLFFL
jgi:hypothetical protein